MMRVDACVSMLRKAAQLWALVLAASLALGASGDSAAQNLVIDDEVGDDDVADDESARGELRAFDAKVFAKSEIGTLFADQTKSIVTEGKQCLEARLTLLLCEMVRMNELTAAQKELLDLAGHGDIDRFMNRFSELRAKLRTAIISDDVNTRIGVYGEARKLRRSRLFEVFGAESLLAKALCKEVSSDQLTRYEESLAERRSYARRAAIYVAVATLEERIPLRAEKRERLVSLLEERLEDFDPGREAIGSILKRIGALPKTLLKEAFDEVQLQNLAPNLEQLRMVNDFARRF